MVIDFLAINNYQLILAIDAITRTHDNLWAFEET